MVKAFTALKQGFELDDRVTFGKNTGSTWRYVAEKTPDYVIWCVGNTDHKFSYELIVEAIKSKYCKKKAEASEERDLDNEANAWKFNKTADPFLPVEDKHSNGFFARPDGFGDWDDDVPF